MTTRQLQPHQFAILGRRYGEKTDQELTQCAVNEVYHEDTIAGQLVKCGLVLSPETIYHAVLEVCAIQMDKEEAFVGFIELLVRPVDKELMFARFFEVLISN